MLDKWKFWDNPNISGFGYTTKLKPKERETIILLYKSTENFERIINSFRLRIDELHDKEHSTMDLYLGLQEAQTPRKKSEHFEENKEGLENLLVKWKQELIHELEEFLKEKVKFDQIHHDISQILDKKSWLVKDLDIIDNEANNAIEECNKSIDELGESIK
jgi:hypothetical protein